MERQVGIGVIGLGWMGRVHTAAYRRLIEHFPNSDLRPRLVVASDISRARRQHGERLGFAQTTGDWRRVIEDPSVEVISVTAPNRFHREMSIAAIEAGKQVWVEKPVGLGLPDTEAVVAAADRSGAITAVGFCYRFAPAVQHARSLISDGAIGKITHYRGIFMCDYANRPDAVASWRFRRAEAGSGALGDLLAHVVDMAHFLVGPISRVCGATATMIPQRPALPMGEGTHFNRSETTELVDVENEDWAAALFQFDGGVYGSLEASRVAVGPRTGHRFEVMGTHGALSWDLERMNEFRYMRLSDDGVDDGYKTIQAGPEHGDYAAFQPGAGVAMGYDDLRTIEAHNLLLAVREGVQHEPGVREMLRTARVLRAVERSHATVGWENTGV